jgi:peptidoglycan/xylan/chitin deacetylase (PgdA/CDA1 family)
LPVFPLESTSSANPEDSPVTIATNAITAATASGDTVIFMIHKVESTISDLVLTSADFQAIVDYVRARPDQVEVMSLSDWYTKASPTANTPPAPNVALNDATNTVTGMAAGMEYNLDGTGYVAYDAGVFSALNLTGRHVLLVRQAAASPIPAGLPKVLIFTADPGAAKIVFTFSDGAQGIVDNALPILQAADFQGTAYVSRDIIGTSPSIMDSTDLNTLSLAGWDISNRPYNNSDVSGLTSEQIQTLFSENRTWLVGNGWTTGANEACYSGTYADPVYQALSALGMHTGVTVLDTAEGLVGTPLGAADEYFRLPVYNVYNGNDYYINRVKAAIDNAVLDGKTVILSIYDVQPGAPTTGGSVLSSAALTDIVNYAKGYANAGQISCVTMSAWYAAQP